jgi:hypothetical protein
MEARVTLIFAANVVALFGTSLNVIPLGHFFAAKFGVGLGWTIILLLSKLPFVLLAPLVTRLAERYGTYRVILHSQWLAALAWGLAGVTFYLGWLDVTAMFIALSFCLATPLPALFPAFLNVLATSTGMAQTSFSNWQIAKFVAVVGALGLGGYLYGYFSLTVFLLAQGAGFLISFLAWKVRAELARMRADPPLSRNFGFVLQSFVATPNLANVFRKAMYGTLQPLLPVFILNEFGSTNTVLGNLYLSLGIAAILGSQLAKRMRLFVPVLITLCLSEGVLILSGFLSDRLLLFFAFLSIAVALMSMVNVGLQTLYLSSQPKSESNWLSSVFEGSSNLGLILGYVIYAYAFDKEVHPPLIPAILLMTIATVGSLLTGVWVSPTVRRIRL